MTAKVVTISASFGAGGSIAGPAVAERLNLPFVDRAIPAAVAQSLDVPIGRAMAFDEKPGNLISRILSKMGAAALPYGATPVAGMAPIEDESVFRSRTEEVLRELCDGSGGVVLGRAAAVVIGRRPGTLHVRLDAPREDRVARIAEREGISEDEAAHLVDGADRAREAYVKHFYRCGVHDSRHYHLSLDTIALGLDHCVDLIVEAASYR